MTPRRTPTRAAGGDPRDFLANATRYLDSARDLLELHDGDSRAKPAASAAVHAAIAFGDALTVARLGQANTKDHEQLADLVERAAGRDADNTQISRLRRILGRKNEADYGPRQWRRAEAEELIKDVDRFANWIHSILR